MSTILIATMHISKVSNQNIIRPHPRSKYYTPYRTNELLLCVPEQTTETILSHIFLIIGSGTPLILDTLIRTVLTVHECFVALISAINRSGGVERMNFSSWSSSCSCRIAGATPNTILGKAASTSRAIVSVSLKWRNYTIWFFGMLLFMIHKHSFAVFAVALQ